MGASIGMAHGMSKALKQKRKGKVVGVIGDSTFVHSGITPLLNMAYNKSEAVVVICDNRTTAMTGMQEQPGTGRTLQGEETTRLEFPALAAALGIKSVRVLNPENIKETRKILKEELMKEGPSVVISSGPCVLLKSKKGEKTTHFQVDPEKCTGCQVCLGLGCPALSWRKKPSEKAGAAQAKPGKKTGKQNGTAQIDLGLCSGCSLCEQLCAAGAIAGMNTKEGK